MSTSSFHRERFFAQWAKTPSERQLSFARTLSDESRRRGLYVLNGETGETRAIPITLSPEVWARDDRDALSVAARHLTRAVAKVAATVYFDEADPWRELLFGGLSALEHAALRNSGPAFIHSIAVARVDYFVDRGGNPWALEVNATIPAMQGYSDIAAEQWTTEFGRLVGASPERVALAHEKNGSNTGALLDTLQHFFETLRGPAADKSGPLLIVARPGDAQTGELMHYAREWSSRGMPTRLCTVDEVECDEAGTAMVRGERFPFVYRHIFGRRIPLGSPMAKLLCEPSPTTVLNPITSPVEVKGCLALLSFAITDARSAARFGLSEEEVDTARRHVPWSRIFRPGPASGPEGETISDLPSWATAHADDIVLKRSWDYGGRAVVLGRTRDDPTIRAKLGALVGKPEASFEEFAAFAARDKDAWILQRFVEAARQEHLVLRAARDGAPEIEKRALVADVSAYCSVGEESVQGGGACRVSESAIVNIVGGGGMAPLVTAEAFDTLLMR